MKTCPVCQAKAFDDAEVCYGCLHRFGDEPEHSSASGSTPTHPPAPAAPEFCIHFTPTPSTDGSFTWNCKVETRENPVI